VVLKSTVATPLEKLDLSRVTVNEITIVGSRCGPFAPALRLLSTGAVITDPMIHARYSLDDGVAALEHAGRRGILKVLIEME
jgi:threonine dehydrogenase-like Zn-dependent dehydrogenase